MKKSKFDGRLIVYLRTLAVLSLVTVAACNDKTKSSADNSAAVGSATLDNSNSNPRDDNSREAGPGGEMGARGRDMGRDMMNRGRNTGGDTGNSAAPSDNGSKNEN